MVPTCASPVHKPVARGGYRSYVDLNADCIGRCIGHISRRSRAGGTHRDGQAIANRRQRRDCQVNVTHFPGIPGGRLACLNAGNFETDCLAFIDRLARHHQEVFALCVRGALDPPLAVHESLHQRSRWDRPRLGSACSPCPRRGAAAKEIHRRRPA